MLGLSSRTPAFIVSACLAGVGLLGCSSLVNPDSDLLGTDPGVDAGTVMLMDSGPTTRDAGTRPDAGGMMCAEGTSRCAGDTLFTCAGGMELPQDCQAMGAFCSGDACSPHVCTPNQRECSSGGTAVLSCSARGDLVSRDACPNGCDPDTLACRPDGGGGCADDADTIEIGESHTINLCEDDNTNTHESSAECTSSGDANLGDRVFSLTVERRQRLTIELTDVDEASAIDTILYIRSVCDRTDSQLACDDDVPCDESTAEPPACFGEVDLRQSRIETTLDPGTYYIVIDGFNYRTDRVSFSCGDVELSVERDSAFPFP